MHTINDIPTQHWKDGALVDYTEQERQALLQSWNADAERIEQHNALEYQRDRATAYPSVADQLDTLYHGGYDAWKATITAVKEEFPKP